MIDVMSSEDYLSSYPANALLPDFVIQKLASEIPSFNRPATFQEYADYFNNLHVSKAAKRPMIEMIKIVGDKK